MSRARLLALTICLAGALRGTADAATVLHFEPLHGYRLGADGGATKPAPNAPTTLAFNAFSRDFTLELEPNGRLAALAAHLDLAPGTAAYRGTVAGRAGSWVRIVLTPAGPTGMVFDGSTLYGIEAGADSAVPAASAPAMFRLADVYFAPGELGCEIGAATVDGAQAVSAMAREFSPLAATGATSNLDLGAVADFEFAQTFGAAAETALLTRFNNVDGIFSEQLGLQITVAEVDVFDASDDPFTASAASALLDELAIYRGATPSQDTQGLTHLFTGRDLDGTTAGIAYLGAVCARRTPFDARSFGVGLSEGRRGATLDSLVAAHEIGHNFGAPHDGDADAGCATTPTTFLMAPSINGSDQFSACSVAQMQAEIAAASCLTPLGAANASLTLAQPGSVLAGIAFDATATVVNTGIDAAPNVTFTAAADTGLTIVSAAAGGTTCSATGNAASCALGTLAGGASRGVTLTLRAGDAGRFNLTASVAADSDDDPADNTAAIAITAAPVVDLAVAGSAPAVQLDQQTTIDATLANSGDFGATGVTVTATLSGGLRPDLATLGGTTCAVAGQTIACAPRALAAHTSIGLAIAATAVAAGDQLVTISAVANEAERAPADNLRALAVTVTAAGGGDGGGGAMSWWAIALLIAGRAWQLREKKPRRRQLLPAPLPN